MEELSSPKIKKQTKKKIKKNLVLELEEEAVLAPDAAAAAQAKPLKEKRKNCPKGTRKNPKTGLCEPIILKEKPVKKASATLSPASAPPSQVTEQAMQGPAIQEQALQGPAPIMPPQEEVLGEAEKKLNNRKEENEIREWNELMKLTPAQDDYAYLYPSLNDPNFNVKIAERKEFNDNRYDGQIADVKEQSDLLCKSDFELAPQQLFVRNFLSMQTPYNSLLLYHGLGSGKTCSAISVAEEMREYNKQIGIGSRIIVVASPNVQENFKVQLFDESKLKDINGLWNISSCTGNNLLKEINPMNMTGLSKENVAAQIKQLINKYYIFMGYTGFANYIIKESLIETSEKMTTKKRNSIIRKKLQKVFNNRLIIIDEVQNIRQTDDNADKKLVASELIKLVKMVDNLRLLLLSATPMYNSYKEIVWLINLMNSNDKRATIEVKDVFDIHGNFKTNAEGEEIGKELLERKATGYISYVRGENPYTFPYRLWPKDFAPMHTFAIADTGSMEKSSIMYPRTQLNGLPILQGIERISLYLVEVGEYQQKGYDCFIKKMKVGKNEISFDNMEAFGYTHLQQPLQALNMIYPSEELDEIMAMEKPLYENINTSELIGEGGLNRLMKFETMPYNKETGNLAYRYNFEYKDDSSSSSSYGQIFAPNEIGKYSGKIKNICDSVINSTGIVMVYTQYIDGGVIPVALALEELGFTRGDTTMSLLKRKVKKIDATTFLTQTEHNKIEGAEPFSPAKYIMITGDKGLSPNNAEIIKKVNEESNKDGRKIKVVLISQAGSEGLDYKCIRQVHVMDPWYNMSRIEQIIGRAVRTCSHKNLPFEKRNVEIYLYGSLLNGEERTLKEAVDLYVYRLAELKAVQIGNVSRVLKEVSIDCILNYGQSNFTVENMQQEVELELSSRHRDQQKIMYAIGDKPFSATCDYSDNCNYMCRPNKVILPEEVKLDTYNEYFITTNTDKIIQRIKALMKVKFFYRKTDLLIEINLKKNYPLVQINAALDQLVEDKFEYITDKYGRLGNLINIDDLYLFQPLEIKNKHISLHDRSTPIETKRDSLSFTLAKNVEEIVIKPGKKRLEIVQGQQAQAQAQGQVQEPAQMQAQVQEPSRVSPLVVVGEENVLRREKELIKLLKRLELMYKHATKHGEQVQRGDDDWYKICSVVIESMENESIADRAELLEFLIEHIIDELKMEDIILLLNNLATLTKNEFEIQLKQALEQKIKRVDELEGILVNNNSENKLLIKTQNDTWSFAQPLDIADFNPLLEGLKKTYLPANEKMHELVGFMSVFKKEEGNTVFKVKDLTRKRNKGARCDQSSKEEALRNLNKIVEEGDRYYLKKELNRKQVCIIQEMFLRLYTKDRKDNKIWFLSAVEANLIDIEKL